MSGKGTGPFFGELYYRSTRPFLDPKTTEREVDYLARLFSSRPRPLLDLGCGHGRHAQPLQARLGRPVVGVDFDALSLGEAAGFDRVQGNFLQLPFKAGAFGDAYVWYSTVMGMPREQHAAALREVHRVLHPGGRFVLQTLPVERLLEQPEASFEGKLPNGMYLTEESRFDAQTCTDHGFRTLHTADKRVLSAAYAIHYYRLDDLIELFQSTGFSVKWVHGALDGSPLTLNSRDLILGAEKNHG